MSIENTLTLCVLPREILRNVLSSYCDDQTLNNVWEAFSTSRQLADNFWILLNQVVDDRIASQALQDQGFDAITVGPQWDLVTSHRNRVFRQRTAILKYCEKYIGVLWCGYMEFTNPLLPEGRTQTAKVMLRCDQGCWNWGHTVAWNHCFRSTVRLVSQIYNFVPIRPRGHIIGVTLHDQAILDNVSRMLQARDQVMTMRFANSQGFILRIISPLQAQHRLARFGWNASTCLGPVTSALICSWENPALSDELGDSLSTRDKYTAIHRIVRALDDS